MGIWPAAGFAKAETRFFDVIEFSMVRRMLGYQYTLEAVKLARDRGVTSALA
jgi:hypothetical protein